MLVAAPLAAPLAAAAGWVLFTSQRGHPARVLLTLLVVVLALTALINEALHDTLLYHLATIWLGFPTHGTGLKLQIEEGSELMAAAALAPSLTPRGAVAVVQAVGRPRLR